MPDDKAPDRGVRKHRQGIVVSKSGDKTIVVDVETREPHPFYGKVMRKHHKFHVHDEKNEAAEGHTVRIIECRPLSRMKRWRLESIVQGHGKPI
jgi:small subunit ribosomal protein S17